MHMYIYIYMYLALIYAFYVSYLSTYFMDPSTYLFIYFFILGGREMLAKNNLGVRMTMVVV